MAHSMGGGGIRPHRRQRARRFQQEDRAEVPSLGCGEEHGRQVAAYTERDARYLTELKGRPTYDYDYDEYYLLTPVERRVERNS